LIRRADRAGRAELERFGIEVAELFRNPSHRHLSLTCYVLCSSAAMRATRAPTHAVTDYSEVSALDVSTGRR
jgi:hypothetical protein